MIPPADVPQNSRLIKVFQQLRCSGRISQALAVLKRQLKRRALEVVEQNIQIIRIQQRVLRRALHQIVRVGHDVLVKRRRRRDVEHDGRSLAPPGAPRLLPCTCDCSRIAAQHARIQRADVDAQLQRVRGHHRVHPSRAKPAFNFAPLCRQIPAAIAAHPPGVPQRVAHHVLQVLRQHLNRQPRPRERNRLNPFCSSSPAIRRVSCKTPLRMPSCRLTTGGL